MYCLSCDNQDLSGSYCMECGDELVQLPKGCASCQNPDATGNFCNLCGNSLSKNDCPFCMAKGQTQPFCGNCGKPLRESVKQEVVVKNRSQQSASGSDSWAVVYCTSHQGNSRMFGANHERVTHCSYCGADSTSLRFNSPDEDLFCSSCGDPVETGNNTCISCGAFTQSKSQVSSKYPLPLTNQREAASQSLSETVETNYLARFALVLGILSVFFFEFVPVPIASVVVSSFALNKSSELAQKSAAKTGKGMSMAGLVLGVVYSVLGFYYLIALR